MNCPRCGRENSGAAAICDGCGHSLGEVSPPAAVVEKVPARLFRLSVISLVLGLTALVVSFYRFGPLLADKFRYRFNFTDCVGYGLLIALPALICGHVVWSCIRRSRGVLWGKRFAAAGLFLGYLFPMFSCFWLIYCYPVFDDAKSNYLWVCGGFMHMIGNACKKYAQDHQGRYPDKLSQLYPQYCGDPTVLCCPMTRSASFRNQDEHQLMKSIDKDTSYIYLPGAKQTDPPKKIVMYDNPENHHEFYGINVLHVDGSVTWERIQKGP